VEPFDDARDPTAAAASGTDASSEELRADVAVAEALQQMFAARPGV
jgi:hypothetical protein